ncbi:MAG: 2-hydroxyacyl-CoA dehydratase [Actinobacteria bacterium]|nr:2-hydroxyacyl-CoA dehydratase [Actinomycetota bacterium]
MVKESKEHEGLLNRVSGIFGVVKYFPDDLSDEEVQGFLHVLPKDIANTLTAMLAPPRVRKASIAWLKSLQEWFDGALEAKREGKKIILAPFNFPPEFIRCFKNAYPLTSEVLSTAGVVTLEGQGERYWDYAMGLGVPDYLCSSNTIELGSMLTLADLEPDAIISAAPGSCDANAKMHELAARTLGIPQLLLEKPVDDSAKGRKAYASNIKALARELEEFLDEELDEEWMRAVLERANRATELYFDLFDLRKIRPSPCPNLFPMYAYGTRFSLWGTDTAVEFMELLVDTVKKRLEEGQYPAEEEIARLFWTYTYYYWDWQGFFNDMEEKGITILGDLLGSSIALPVDTTSKESMIAGLAETCSQYGMTRQMGAPSMSAQWIDDITNWTTELDADACVYCGHHSCKQTWSVFSITRGEIMKRRKIPTLMLQGDSWIRRMLPMSAIDEQIDEFVKTVVRKRSTPARMVG